MHTQSMNPNSQDAKDRIRPKQKAIRLAILEAVSQSGPMTLDELVRHPTFKDMKSKDGMPLKEQSIRSRVPEMIESKTLARTGQDKIINGGRHYLFDVYWRVFPVNKQKELLGGNA